MLRFGVKKTNDLCYCETGNSDDMMVVVNNVNQACVWWGCECG